MEKFKSYIDSITKELSCTASEKQELAEEFADHLYLLKQEYIEKGFMEEEAVNMAIHTFGENHNLGKELQKSMFPFRKIINSLLWAIFIFYSMAVVFELFLKRIPDRDSFFRTNYNLIPFYSLTDYIVHFDRFNFDIWFFNIFGNVILFIPFGFFIPLLFRKVKGLRKITYAACLASLGIEILQFLTRLGQLDVDDIILNVLGGMLGFFLVTYLSKWKVLPKKYFTIN